MAYDTYLAKLYNGTFKGFNIVFGNIFDQEDGKCGTLRWYQSKNVDPSVRKFEPPRQLMTNRAQGMSNGDINAWGKVISGRHDFFQEFLRAEREVLDVDTREKKTLERFMGQFAERLFTVMQNDAE